MTIETAAAQSHRLSSSVADRKNHSPAKTVVDRSVFTAAHQARAQQLLAQ
ncbi:hypothetical protein GGI1_09348 [Acidithiobacillus sp. GGI-221]|nr:hypothetical protein GGI1_09348 [Acidithiobacillus sp. GGI-221]